MIKCLIVKSASDELDYLQDFINQSFSFHVKRYEGNLITALQSMDGEQPELVICDLSLFASLQRNCKTSLNAQPVFVCTTHQQEFDFDSFPIKPFSVLRYPVSYERFLTTIERAQLFIQGEAREARQPAWRDFVFVKSEYKIIKVKYDDILFCEGMKDYTQIYLFGRPQPLLTLYNLKNFAAKLPAGDFVRVHRSFVVSLRHIETISRNEITLGKRIIPIGNSYRNNIFQIVERNS